MDNVDVPKAERQARATNELRENLDKVKEGPCPRDDKPTLDLVPAAFVLGTSKPS